MTKRKCGKRRNGLRVALFALCLILPVSAVCAGDALDRAEARARELCARMTLEEKAGELMVYDYMDLGKDHWRIYTNMVCRNEIGALMRVLSAKETRRLQEFKMANSRLGIPLIVHEDITHGWVTTLPSQIAIACSWDDAAIEKAEAVAAREAAAIGIQLTYSPQVDVSDDPRWGRIGCTNGEDPYLSGRVGAARVRGCQGRTFEELTDGEHIIACPKHYAGYSSLQGGKDYRHKDFSRRELLETHLPPFQAAIEAGALSLMNAYTVCEGVPCNFNSYLLKDILRNQWGFRGQLITDWTTLTFSIDEGAATDVEDAAKRGLEAGVDMDMISRAFLALPRLVREGGVRESDVDVAVVRSLALKYLMGLFDDPYRFCDEKKSREALMTDRNKADVLALTRETLVLLKNDRVLPLDTMKRVGLTGTWADDDDAHRGGMGKDMFNDYDVDAGIKEESRMQIDTIKTAMAKRWGANLDYEPMDMLSVARGLGGGMPKPDVVVLVIGEPTHYTGERRGRARIELPDSELENLRALKRAGKKIVSVVFAGRPFIMNEIVWLSDAVILAWYPGAMGGQAVAEVLSGEVNPSGKLAQHIPFDVGQIPLSYREKRTFINCSYADIPSKPLFPFGFGLSYTMFAYGKPVADKTKYTVGEKVRVRVPVKNTGSVAGREVVQLYVRDEVASVLPRERELKEFTSVWLKPGEEKTVEFVLDDNAFALYDKDLKRVVEPGAFTIYVGPDSTTMNATQISLK
ncbi:MAG: glycoside hydrolase family 3 C-terminal domain-containing protein [Kiritimatiellae bacterium]|nr:glycoside hydrolase family 3 C-terminal domain-containing protein [Kiritimatiellia bacterium]